MELDRPMGWAPQVGSAHKRHRAQNSIAKGLRSLVIDSPESSPVSPSGSKRHMFSRSGAGAPPTPPKDSPDTPNADPDAWDLVDDLPLRWATDFVPLTSPNSRISSLDVTKFELFRSENNSGRPSTTMLAVASKSCILIYEAPHGERAFRFVKVTQERWKVCSPIR